MTNAFEPDRQSVWARRVSRRGVLRGGSLAGIGIAGAALIGCSGDDDSSTPTASATTGTPGGGGLTGSVTATTATGGDETPVRGGNLRTEWAGGMSGWDPYRTSTGYMWHYSNLTDRLVFLDNATGNPGPGLLASWEAVEGGIEYTLKVQPDAVWQDIEPTNGRHLDAEDIVHNIEYGSGIATPDETSNLARRSWYGDIASVEAVDDTTVNLKFASPNAGFFAAMGDPRQLVIPKEIPGDNFNFDEDHDRFPSIGPFLTETVRPGESASYTKNPNYWQKGLDGQALPYVDRTEVAWYGDDASMIAALLAGQLDVARLTSLPQVGQLEGNDDVTVWKFPARSQLQYVINSERFPDERLWKALNLLDDKAVVNKSVYADAWTYSGPVCSALPFALAPDAVKALPGYNPDTREADIAEGMKLLDALGNPEGDGLSMSVLVTPSGEEPKDLAVNLQAVLSSVAPRLDFKVDVAPDSATRNSRHSAIDFDISYIALLEAPDIRLATTAWMSGGSRNYMHYSNPDVDALVTASQGQDGDELAETMKKLQDILLEAAPMISQALRYDLMASRSNVGGFAAQGGFGSAGAYNIRATCRGSIWLKS